MSSLQEQLDRLVKRSGANGWMVQQLRNQIMAEKRNQSTQELFISGITANHSSKTDARFMANQTMGEITDD